MTLPVLPLSRIRAVAGTDVSSGRVVAVERIREWRVGISVGTAEAMQVLLSDPSNRAHLVNLASLRMERLLDLGAASDLLLTLDKDEGEARHWDHVVGCMGVTRHGLVLCAAGGRGDLGRWRTEFISMESGWTVLSEVQDLVPHGRWFTQWHLSLLDAHERQHRIVGNPNWPTWPKPSSRRRG